MKCYRDLLRLRLFGKCGWRGIRGHIGEGAMDKEMDLLFDEASSENLRIVLFKFFFLFFL